MPNKSVFSSFEEDGEDKLRSVGGLTKRELGAFMCMQGMLANPSLQMEKLPVVMAVAITDRLLSELNQESHEEG